MASTPPSKSKTRTIDRSDVTLQGRLVGAIRDAILDGELVPGQHLKEREMCAMFDVSRSLVREAIQTLSGEDLVQVVPHRGPIVSTMDRKSAADLYAVRGVLEGLACAEFTRHADERTRSELFDIFEGLKRLSEDDPPQALVAAKNDFYRCLSIGCNNDVVAQLLTQLNNRTMQLRRLSLSRQGRLPNTLREISTIIDAIRADDPDAAQRAAQSHVAAAAAIADARFDDLETDTLTKTKE